MSLFRQSFRRRSPPVGLVKANPDWVARGLSFLTYGNGIVPLSIPDAAITRNGLVAEATPYGPSPAYNGSSIDLQIAGSITGSTPNGATLFALARAIGLSADAAIISQGNTAGGSRSLFRLYFVAVSSAYGLQFRDNSDAIIQLNTGVAESAPTPYRFLTAVYRTGAGEKSLWMNGAKKASDSTTTGTMTLNVTSVGSLVRDTTAGYFNGRIPLAGIINRALSDQEVVELSNSYWDLFASSRKSYWLGPVPTTPPLAADLDATESGDDTFAGTGSYTSAGPATAVLDATESGSDTFAGTGTAPETVVTVSDNGVWTWYNDERVRYYNGHYYAGYVTSGGDIGITKYNPSTGVKSSYTLATAFETDDHDNPSIYILPNGKIVVAYCAHGGSIVNTRVSTNAEDVSAWGSVNYTNITTSSYAHIFKCGAYYWVFFRASANSQNYVVRTTDFVTYGTPAQITNNGSGNRPYVKYCQNGDNRIDVFFSEAHPGEIAGGHNRLYHIYLTESAGALVGHKSDGTSTTLPAALSDATLVFDSVGESTNAWTWQIRPDIDGYPRVLFARFESTTDHRAMFSRWNGSAWTTPTQIATMGTYLYSAEPYYSGGMTFDGNSPNHVYLSKQVGSYWEIQEYGTTDDGANWSKTRDVTASSSVKNCRPYSPVGHAGKAVFWWAGTYSSYTSFNTDILANDGPIYSDVVITGELAATESGGDTFSGTGTVSVAGTLTADLAATESGEDAFSGAGILTPVGAISANLAATESGSDTFAGAGSWTAVSAAQIYADLAATESGFDLAHLVARFDPYTVTVMAPTGSRRYPLRKQTATMPGAQ
jgi:hypothetical protein